jgi:hypothetical protein
VILMPEVKMPRTIRDEADARDCLARAAASKQKRGDWARAHGVDGRSLYQWSLRLPRVEPAAELRLVELVARPEARPGTRYTIRVGDLAVEVDDSFDDAVLRRLISVVASC